MQRRKRHGIAWSLVSIILAAALSVLLISLDAFERMYEFTRSHEHWEIDEFALVTVSCLFAGLVYAVARLRMSLKAQQSITTHLINAHAEMLAAKDESELARQNAELADDLKTEAIARVVEDVTTSSNDAAAKLGLLRKQIGFISTEDSEALVIDAQKSIRNLGTLVYDLKKAERLQQDALITRWEDVDVAAIMEKAIDGIRPLATAKSLSLDFTPERTAHSIVRGQAGRLMKAFVPTLLNAINRSPANGKISIEATGDRLNVIMRVMDEGPHLSSQVAKQLFDKFDLNPSTVDRGYEIPGIEMSSTRLIIERHNGTLSFENLPDGGAAFLIELPTV